MLINPKFTQVDPEMRLILETIGGAPADPQQLANGVFQIDHHNGNHLLDRSDGWGSYEGDYPNLDSATGDYFGSYGVCDSLEQILEQCPMIVTDPTRQFTIFMTPVTRAEQPDEGGWRWHKWGGYIGDQDPQCEYLYDEQDIDLVYCYHIYERLTGA